MAEEVWQASSPSPEPQIDLRDLPPPEGPPERPLERQSPRSSSSRMAVGCIVSAGLFAGLVGLAAAAYIFAGLLSMTPRSPSPSPFADDTTIPYSYPPLPAPVTLGQTQKTRAGNSVTVHALEYPAHPDEGVTDQPLRGSDFAAVDVEVCATSTPVRVYADLFELYDSSSAPEGVPTRTSIRSPAFAGPKLNADVKQPLGVGSCRRGWLSYYVYPPVNGGLIVGYRDELPGSAQTQLAWQ